MKKYVELAKKIKALVDQGQGGEKYNAQKQLDGIMHKYGIRKEDLEEAEQSSRTFIVPKNRFKLFYQIYGSVVGSKRPLMVNKKKPTHYSAELSKVEETEIRIKADLYSRLYDEELQVFLSAFVQRNNLLCPDDPTTDPDKLTDEEYANSLRAEQMARSIKKRDYFRELSDA